MNKDKGIIKMKIAVTYDNGEIFQHFGHTEQFKLYDIENGKVVASEVVGTNGSGMVLWQDSWQNIRYRY